MFREGAIRHTAVIPIAGDQMTNDIAMTLRTPTKEAEELKIRHGCALRQLADPNDIIEVPGVGDRPPRKLSRQTLAEVIEPRIEELYTLVQPELRQLGLRGAALVGDRADRRLGAACRGWSSSARRCSTCRCASACPRYSGGLADVVQSPRYATAVGLLTEGRDQQVERGIRARQTGSFGATLRRMSEWFQAQFLSPAHTRSKARR